MDRVGLSPSSTTPASPGRRASISMWALKGELWRVRFGPAAARNGRYGTGLRRTSSRGVPTSPWSIRMWAGVPKLCLVYSAVTPIRRSRVPGRTIDGSPAFRLGRLSPYGRRLFRTGAWRSSCRQPDSYSRRRGALCHRALQHAAWLNPKRSVLPPACNHALPSGRAVALPVRGKISSAHAAAVHRGKRPTTTKTRMSPCRRRAAP